MRPVSSTEVCPLIRLSDREALLPSTHPTEQALVSAAQRFLINSADAIACSQTGQLSARLYVDVVETLPELSLLSDWDLTERVLCYCSHRLRNKEPLSEGMPAFCSRIPNSTRLTNKAHSTAKDTITDEIRVRFRSIMVVIMVLIHISFFLPCTRVHRFCGAGVILSKHPFDFLCRC